MRGLTIVLTAGGSPADALELAAATAALGGRARLFAQGRAAGVLAAPCTSPDDAARAQAGLPTFPQLLDEALGLGVELIACQSGLAWLGLRADALHRGVTTGGLVGVLQTLGDDRLATL